MTRLEVLNKELEIAYAMKAELVETITIEADENINIESERLYKFLKKTTEKVNEELNKRLNKLDKIILDISNDIAVESGKEPESNELEDAANLTKEEQSEEDDGITEFEKMIRNIFSESPVSVKVIKIRRD